MALPFSAFFYGFCVFLCNFCIFVSAAHRYSSQDLIDIGYQHKTEVSREFQSSHSIPNEIARPPGSPWFVIGPGKWHRWRTERKQKRGRRLGRLLRLKKQPHNPPLPSLYLTNARSLIHKTEELELQLAGNRFVRDCCALIITESWLTPTIPDANVKLAGHYLHCWDRTVDSGKKRGG